MAEAEEDGGAKAAPKSKKKLMIIGGAAAVALVLGGGGYFVLAKKSGAKAHGEQTAENDAGHGAKDDGHGGAKAAAPVVSYVDLPEMTVNLATIDPEKQRYLRLSVALEVEKPEMATAIKPMMPRVIDSFQTHLRALRPDDVKGSSGAYRLKEELLRRVNTAISPAKVDAVLFKDIVIQ